MGYEPKHTSPTVGSAPTAPLPPTVRADEIGGGPHRPGRASVLDMQKGPGNQGLGDREVVHPADPLDGRRETGRDLVERVAAPDTVGPRAGWTAQTPPALQHRGLSRRDPGGGRRRDR